MSLLTNFEVRLYSTGICTKEGESVFDKLV